MKLFELNGTDGQNVGQNPALRNAAMARLRTSCPLLEYLEFYQIQGSSDKPRKPSTAEGGQTRAINSTFAANNVDPEFGDVSLKIFGDNVQTDRAWERRGTDIDSQRVADLDAFAEKLGWDLMNRLVNDTDGATTWDGLKALVPAGNNIVFDSVNGGEVPLGNASADKKQQQKFFEQFRRVLNYVGPGAVILWNADAAARIESVFWEFVSKQNVKNAVEEDVEIVRFRGRPVVDAGYQKDGSTLVIPNDETAGSSTDCTSIYIFKPGERRDLAGASNNGLNVTDQGLIGSHYTTVCEVDAGFTLLRDKALYRISGIRLTT